MAHGEDPKDAGLPRDILDAYEVPAPSAALADRVMAQIEKTATRAEAAGPTAASRPRRAGPWVIATMGAAIVAAGMLFFVGRVMVGPGGNQAGTRLASVREEVQVGARAVAVLEAGGDIAWSVASRGDARVEQRAGEVFYRVERGGPFVVATPAGEVSVLGTCFKVEVVPVAMKSNVVSAVVGAAATAAVFVTVYEGKVLLANEHGNQQIVAGGQAYAEAGSAPKVVSGDAPEAHVAAGLTGKESREELLLRDQAQRSELAALRSKVQALQGELARGPAPGARRTMPQDVTGPTQEELQNMAKECRIAFDMPPLNIEPPKLDSDDLEKLGLSSAESTVLEKSLVSFHRDVTRELRALYIEVTGADPAKAEDLSPSALGQDIEAKSSREETQLIFQRLSQERAGMVAAPTSLKDASPVERYFRLMTSLGNRYEETLAGVLGRERAHALRQENNGWGSQHGMSAGCPGEK